jgi:hypothetical protein
MSTRIHRFIPADTHHVPAPEKVSVTLEWLRAHVDAYKIDAISPGHIIFFDCGEGLDKVLCPVCGTDVGDPFWKDWMDSSYDEDAGFMLTLRALACCKTDVRLDQLVYDAPCTLGSFAIEITDTMKTWPDVEIEELMREIAQRLDCPLIRIDAHY